MRLYKNNKGISLVALAITIILLIILAGIVVFNFFGETQDKALKAKVLEEFIQIEDAIKLRGQVEHKTDPEVYPYLGKALSSDDTVTIRNIVYGDNYYLVTQSDLNQLGVNPVMHQYVVNYQTGEVISVEAYIVNSRAIYTKSDLIEEETGNGVTNMVEYDDIKKVNKPVLYAGMVPVKRVGSDWVATTTSDEEWYDYAIGGADGPVRYANVMMLDDLTLRDDSNTYSNEEVRGMTIDSMAGKTVVQEGSMFVWIPRYTYKEQGGAMSIVYSKLTQDYILDGYIKPPAFYRGDYSGATPDNDNAGFEPGGKELTGFWISKYAATYVN